MDHGIVSGSCITCHNGSTVPGKPANHIPVPNTCEACHSTKAWSPARMDHSIVSGSCITCHNGTLAPGKPANHIPAPNTCELCHTTRA
jgi:hypothetical protein